MRSYWSWDNSAKLPIFNGFPNGCASFFIIFSPFLIPRACHEPEAGLGDVAEVVPGAVQQVVDAHVQAHPRESVIELGVEQRIRGQERRAGVPVHVAPGEVQVQVSPHPQIGLRDDFVTDVLQGIDGPQMRFQLLVLRLVAVSQAERTEEEIGVPHHLGEGGHAVGRVVGSLDAHGIGNPEIGVHTGEQADSLPVAGISFLFPVIASVFFSPDDDVIKTVSRVKKLSAGFRSCIPAPGREARQYPLLRS